jgi:Permease for cytosine/purines, uracil, thiamine, allantoin
MLIFDFWMLSGGQWWHPRSCGDDAFMGGLPSIATGQEQNARKYVETRHRDHIPASARHGKPWQQFAFWWGSNVHVFNLALGGVVITGKMSLGWPLIAIAVGVGAPADHGRHEPRRP